MANILEVAVGLNGPVKIEWISEANLTCRKIAMIGRMAYSQSCAYIPELHGTNCINLYYTRIGDLNRCTTGPAELRKMLCTDNEG